MMVCRLGFAEVKEVIVQDTRERQIIGEGGEHFLRRIEGEADVTISSCYQCERCTNACPVAQFMDIKPHQVIRYVQLDRILFGVGSQRGRKSSSRLHINDVIDFWRVEDLRKDERLLLRSEMKLPGRAWLEFSLHEEGEGRKLSISAYFDARGLFGKIYWYLFWPFHHSIFQGLIEQIEQRA